MSAASARYGAVLIVGFGGPESAAEIRPFLDRVLAGRPVPPARYEDVVHHYELIGGRSPYNEITARQAKALAAQLRRDGIELPVAIAMRNAAPFPADTIRRLTKQGVRRMLGFVMAAHRCEASWDRYLANVEAARVEVGVDAPAVDYLGPWHDNPFFAEAVADRIAGALARFEPPIRERARLIFTAHSIPVAMASASRYVEEITESARMAADRAGAREWSLAFQSRSGSPRDPWLEPDVSDSIRALGAGDAAVLVPIGFLSDHVEVLYDLDIEAAETARVAGVRLERAATVGDHPRFIEMIAALIREHLERASALGA